MLGYILSDNYQSVTNFCATYNGSNQNISYETDAIPATASIFLTYNPATSIFGFCIIDDHMKSDLEKAVIYSDDQVFNDVMIGSSHDPRDMWSVALTMDQVQALLDQQQITVRFTVDGKNSVFDVSPSLQDYLYEMVNSIIRASLYADQSQGKYRSEDLLPGGSLSTETAAPTEAAKYSFQEDYDALDHAAKSIFLVLTCNSSGEYTGNASGFVMFEEHLFVTNQHVIDGSSYIEIYDDNEQMAARLDKVIVSDREQDIAILAFPEGYRYDSLEYDVTTELKRGQPVTTIGSPQGLSNTVAFGNISAFPVFLGNS